MSGEHPRTHDPVDAATHRKRMIVAAITASIAMVLAVGSFMFSRPAAPKGEGVEVFVPDLHARSGAVIKATITAPGSSRVRVTMKGPGMGLRRLAEVDVPHSPRSTIARVDMRELSAGEYTIVVEALGERGTPLASRSHTFTKRVTGLPAVSFDEDNSVMRDGRPYFPVGVWMSHMQTTRNTSLSKMCAEGTVNTAVVQGRRGLGERDDEAFSALLQQCENADATGIGPARGGDHTVDVTRIVKRSRRSSALLSWMWIDEPEYNRVSPEQVREWTEAAHAADPDHPVLVNLVGAQFVDQGGTANSARQFTSDLAQAGKPLPADWISTDYYPIAFSASFGTPLQTSFDHFANHLTLVREWTLGLYPTATFIETASQPGLGSESIPTPNQVWAETWIAVARGVKGIFWFPHDGASDPGTAAVQARATTYLTRFAPVLAEPDYAGAQRFHLTGSRVDFISKKHGGKVYVFAVNRDIGSSARARFTMEDAGIGEIEVYGERRTVVSDGTSFSDDFEPYAVHIYVITPAD